MTRTLSTPSAWGTTLLRVAIGIVFVAHGAQKLFQYTPTGLAGLFGQLGIPFPALNAYLVIAIELIGGVAMIAGLGTRVLGALFSVIMVVAIATVHGAHGFFLPQGYEYTLVLLAGSLALTLQGAGALAVDSLFTRANAGPGPAVGRATGWTASPASYSGEAGR